MALIHASLSLRGIKPSFSKNYLPENTSDCKVCLEILKAFERPISEKYTTTLGSVSSILPLRNACPDHSSWIGELISHHDHSNEPLGSGLQRTATDLSAYERKVEVTKLGLQTSIVIQLVYQDEQNFLGPVRNLVFRSDVKDHYGNAVILNANYIDINRIKHWKAECENNHKLCKTRPKTRQKSRIRPKLLIDIEKRCIVPGDSTDQDYVALSYCWGVPEPGKPAWFRNQKSILQKLMHPNALSSTGEFGMKLPGTIKDTIELVHTIGERFLWVDSLCIVQDDDEMHNSELPKMSEIYAFAYITVIAAEGSHADFGLPGFEFSRKRSIKQSIIKLGQERLIEPIRYMFERDHIAYHTRGWTFQEYNFAKRRLILEGQSIRWECRESSWCEDLVSSTDFGVWDSNNSWDVTESRIPDVLELNNMINEYNPRDLGRKEDALPAFLGIQKVMSQYYPQGFIYGMPIYFFDISMAWTPSMNRIERRKSSVPRLSPPSWSWLGWSGRIDIGFNGDQLLKDRRFRTLHVTKLVDWYSMIDPESPKLPVKSSSQRFDENWSLYKEPRILYCKTSRVFLHLSESLFESEIDKICYGPWFSVRDNSGKWSGIIRLHSEEDAKSFGTSKTDNLIELVAVSRGYGPDQRPGHGDYGLTEWHARDRPRREGEEYHYYNVLWIAWENGVAYRKCGGRISKEMWEISKPEIIDLILG